MTQGRNAHMAAVLRDQLVKRLVMQWVRTNRPDVIAAAKDEAAKKFPLLASRTTQSITLPPALAKLKG